MYAIRVDGDLRPRTNDALREYARLEYGREDVHWLIASAKAAPKAPRRIRRPRFLARRAIPARRPVACKGTPRRQPQEATSPG